MDYTYTNSMGKEFLTISAQGMKEIPRTLSDETRNLLVKDISEDIDLSPLARLLSLECLRLESTSSSDLDLTTNREVKIDLAPLESCPKLNSVELSGRSVSSLILPRVEQSIYFSARFTSLRNLDLSPLSEISSIMFLCLDAPLENIVLPSFENIIEKGIMQSEISLSGPTPSSFFSEPGLGFDDYHGPETIDLSLMQGRLFDIHLSGFPKLSQVKFPKTIPRGLTISGGNIEDIHLDVFEHSDIRSLALTYQKIPTIDISPLSTCKEFHALDLRGNLIEELDITTLFKHPEMIDIEEVEYYLYVDENVRLYRVSALGNQYQPHYQWRV